jgi:pheromone shutdown protein TraB
LSANFTFCVLQARKVPNCQVHLGDRPINITLQRALSSLSWWQTTKLTWHILTSRDPISKEEVEKCKQKDLLEDMLEEMTGEFPALSKVFVHERDLFLGMQIHHALLS